jgi:integrase
VDQTARRGEAAGTTCRRQAGKAASFPALLSSVQTEVRWDPEDFEWFARDQIAERRADVTPATSRYREWALSHLLPYFSGRRLAEIDARPIDGYRAHKVGESEARRRALEQGRPVRDRRGQPLRPLSPASINKTIDVLQWLLSLAVEYGHVDRNPALGRRRRLTARRRRQRHLDSADQIEALLRAAAELDRDPRWLIPDRLPVITTLLFAGLRAHELAALRWRDIDLPARRIYVRRSKTPAGEREISLLPILARHLLAHRDHLPPKGPDDLVFRTGRDGVRTKDNVRWRVVAPALARADRLLEADGHPPLPEGLTPHSLRHTFASLLIATGEDPVSVMCQMGHADPGFTLRTYGHLMRRHPEERARLGALIADKEAVAGPLPSTGAGLGKEVSSAGLRRGFRDASISDGGPPGNPPGGPPTETTARFGRKCAQGASRLPADRIRA